MPYRFIIHSFISHSSGNIYINFSQLKSYQKVIFCSSTDDNENDMSFGLSSSDVDYLQTETQPVPINDNDGLTFETAEINELKTSESDVVANPQNFNGEYSGVLLQNFMLPSGNQSKFVGTVPELNSFVQVSNANSVAVASEDGLAELHSVVCTPVSMIPTKTTVTLTDIGSNNLQVVAQKEGKQASTTVVNTNTHFQLPVDSLKVNVTDGQPYEVPVEMISTPTTNTHPCVYILSMSVEDDDNSSTQADDNGALKTTITKNAKSNGNILPEPQRTSTPKMSEEVMINLNETILAGNIVQRVTTVTNEVNQQPSTTATKSNEEVPKIIESIQQINEENRSEKNVDEKNCHNNKSVSLDVKALPAHSHQIGIVNKEKDTVNLDATNIHNKMYCRDWVSKNSIAHNVTQHENTMLAQSNFSGQNGDSFYLTSLNTSSVTSVSCDMPEQREEQVKFFRKPKHDLQSKKPTTESAAV